MHVTFVLFHAGCFPHDLFISTTHLILYNVFLGKYQAKCKRTVLECCLGIIYQFLYFTKESAGSYSNIFII